MNVLKMALGAAGALIALAPAAGRAQIERLSPARQDKEVAALAAQVKAGLPAGPMKEHLERVQKDAAKNREAAVLAERVYSDVSNAVPSAPFVYYAVPPMSDVQRLEDVYPIDGLASAPVRIVSAKGEYEPGSFLVYPLSDLGKVKFSLSPFKTAKGQVFPADKLDLKVVKVWCQNKNGWYSYFGDTGFKLCPELLLNDEDLIRVDEEKLANYARLVDKDGKVTERWLNPPRQFDGRFYDHWESTHGFQSMRPDFHDAATLQPVLLKEGRFRNFFLTAHVTPDIAEGTYRGAVKLTDNAGKSLGEIPVTVTVLPFELPKPKAYLDPDRDFYVCSYSYISLGIIMSYNGGDLELARKQLVAVLRDQVEHNQDMHWVRGGANTEGLYTLKVMEDVGMRTDAIVGGIGVDASSRAPDFLEAQARRQMVFWDKRLGHHNFFVGMGDEPPASWLERNRPIYEAYQKYGFKFIIAGGNQVFNKTGYLYDWHNVAKWPEDESSVVLWNRIGQSHIAWYADMHIGPENPAFNRRQYGIAAYLAGYSAFCNYAHHFGSFNDDRTTYKPMVFAYGTGDGVIDTIQWEGFREGIDDIRYATLMTSLAREAAKSKDIKTRYAGTTALQYLAGLNRENVDLDVCRTEMTRHILDLCQRLGR